MYILSYKMTVHVTVTINWFWKWLAMSVFIFIFVSFWIDWKIFFLWNWHALYVRFCLMKRKQYCCQIFLFRIADFLLILHSLMFEVTNNVVLLVFLYAWKGKCHCNTDVCHTFLLAGGGGGGGRGEACTLNIFIWKYSLCLYCVLCWHPVWLKVWKVVLEKRRKITWWQTPAISITTNDFRHA